MRIGVYEEYSSVVVMGVGYLKLFPVFQEHKTHSCHPETFRHSSFLVFQIKPIILHQMAHLCILNYMFVYIHEILKAFPVFWYSSAIINALDTYVACKKNYEMIHFLMIFLSFVVKCIFLSE